MPVCFRPLLFAGVMYNQKDCSKLRLQFCSGLQESRYCFHDLVQIVKLAAYSMTAVFNYLPVQPGCLSVPRHDCFYRSLALLLQHATGNLQSSWNVQYAEPRGALLRYAIRLMLRGFQKKTGTAIYFHRKYSGSVQPIQNH